ncbi:asparaginase [Streptomyces collinus]|uniref:asparaginase n=1 Tax=Streptomyces collinus TaxID=42684 RepID=UPI00367BCE0C
MRKDVVTAQKSAFHNADHDPLIRLLPGDIIEGVQYGAVVILTADGRINFQAGELCASFKRYSACRSMRSVAVFPAGMSMGDALLPLSTASNTVKLRPSTDIRQTVASVEHSERGRPVDSSHMPFEPAIWLEGRDRHEGLSGNAQTCTGQHAAMLFTSRMAGWALTRYLRQEQKSVADATAELILRPATGKASNGCSTPLLLHRLLCLTRAFARIASEPRRSDKDETALAKCQQAEVPAEPGHGFVRWTLVESGLLAMERCEAAQVIAMYPAAERLATRL